MAKSKNSTYKNLGYKIIGILLLAAIIWWVVNNLLNGKGFFGGGGSGSGFFEDGTDYDGIVIIDPVCYWNLELKKGDTSQSVKNLQDFICQQEKLPICTARTGIFDQTLEDNLYALTGERKISLNEFSQWYSDWRFYEGYSVSALLSGDCI